MANNIYLNQNSICNTTGLKDIQWIFGTSEVHTQFPRKKYSFFFLNIFIIIINNNVGSRLSRLQHPQEN